MQISAGYKFLIENISDTNQQMNLTRKLDLEFLKSLNKIVVMSLDTEKYRDFAKISLEVLDKDE